MVVLFFHNVVLKGRLRNFYAKVTEFLIESYLISIRKSPNCLFYPKDLRLVSLPLLSLSEKLDTQESVFPILSANMLKPYSSHFEYNA